MGVHIRPATSRDYDELCEIIEEVDGLHREQLPHLFQKPDGPIREWTYYMAQLKEEDIAWFVAELKGQLAGFVHVEMRDTPPIPIVVPRRVAIVDNLAVRQGMRRAGIGRALMQRAEQWARQRGADDIELTVYEFNQAAIAFYRSLGYETSNRRMDKRLR